MVRLTTLLISSILVCFRTVAYHENLSKLSNFDSNHHLVKKLGRVLFKFSSKYIYK